MASGKPGEGRSAGIYESCEKEKREGRESRMCRLETSFFESWQTMLSSAVQRQDSRILSISFKSVLKVSRLERDPG